MTISANDSACGGAACGGPFVPRHSENLPGRRERRPYWGRTIRVAGMIAAGFVWTGTVSGADVPAFPGAEGAGAMTPGGRGGAVLIVTNLADDGPGSLRAAIDTSGVRTIVFRVGGTIRLKSPLVIKNPFLTIAGQSAPGDGICLRDQPLLITTNHVIIRHLRSRLGDESAQQVDCITLLGGASQVILDHCSASWSIDEALSLSGDVANVTVQWCLIGEPLRQSKHVKGPHGYGSLSRATGPVSWHHNLWIHCDARNPRLGDYYGKGAPTFDVRNNVIYDYGATASGLTQGRLRVNYVANYIRPGPSSTAKTPITIGPQSDIQFFIRDNVVDGRPESTADNTRFFNVVEFDGKRQVATVETPFDMPAVTTVTAEQTLEHVLASVGATRPRRDAVDARLVEHVRTRGGRIINSQAEIGGWPVLAAGTPPTDADDDGMPDDWEVAHGLNSRDASDANGDGDRDGYTNLEEFLNGLCDPPEAGDATARGRTVLWNGRDLAGWNVFLADASVDPRLAWSANDGVLRLASTANGYVRTTESFSNYHLHVEWRWPADVEPNANSGVMLHVHGPDVIWPASFEAQLKNQNAGQVVGMGLDIPDAPLLNNRKRAPRFADPSEKPPGEWNTYEIHCRGDTIEVFVNGVRQNHVTRLPVAAGAIAL